RRERIQLVLVPAGREREIGHRPHNSLPASAPLDQAHWRLKPPQSPSMSSTSPQAYSPGTRRLRMVAGSNSAVLIPPAVTWAVPNPSVPRTGRSKRLAAPARDFKARASRVVTGASCLTPAYLASILASRLGTAPMNISPAVSC